MTKSKSLAGVWLPNDLNGLYYGPGTVQKHLVSSLPSKSSKAFILTGNSLATKTNLIKQVEDLLKDQHAGTFSKIGEHAPVAQLDQAASLVVGDSNIDTVISVGGGSPIDSAKAVTSRVKEKTGRTLYHISIPTTISAAECTAGGGYTKEDGVKVTVKGKDLLAKVILYDAKFCLDTPVQLYTSTGLRALDHCMEAMYNSDASEFCRMMSLQAAGKLFKYLPLYNKDPKNESIITELQIACYASFGFVGLNVKQPLGLSHTLGYALGSPYGIPHGKTSCMTLGHVVKLKAKDPEAASQIARMAPFIGLQSRGSDEEVATAVGEKILELVKELGLLTTLTEWKVNNDQVDTIVKRATGGTSSGPVYDAVANLVKGLW